MIDLLLELPHPMNDFGFVITSDEKYVITFGGYHDVKEQERNEIFILDLNSMKFRKSKIKCPMEQGHHAVLMTANDEYDGVLIECYLNNDNHDRDVPVEIIDLVKTYYCRDFVHLMHMDTGKHWKIEVDAILNDGHSGNNRDVMIRYLEWKLGSKLSIYSRSKDTWFDGEIVNVYFDKDTGKEWFVVKYNGNKKKSIQRLCKDIRPV